MKLYIWGSQIDLLPYYTVNIAMLVVHILHEQLIIMSAPSQDRKSSFADLLEEERKSKSIFLCPFSVFFYVSFFECKKSENMGPSRLDKEGIILSACVVRCWVKSHNKCNPSASESLITHNNWTELKVALRLYFIIGKGRKWRISLRTLG